MRRPGQSADDGSRSSGIQPGRGAALLAVAVVLGIVLLNAADDAPPDRVSSGSSATTPSDSTSSTLAAPTTVVTLPLRAPADVKVITGNGTTTKGVAGKARDQLKAAGYNVLAPTDATKATASAVYFVGDYTREAEGVATSLGLPPSSVAAVPTPPPLPDARGANVIVVVGPELAQRLTPTSATTAAGGATTTTAAGGATTSTTRAGATSSTSKP